MRTLLWILPGLALFLGACTLNRALGSFNARPADLEYLEESFGGLDLDPPRREEGRVLVPVRFGRTPARWPRPYVIVHAWRSELEQRTALVTALVTQAGDGAESARELDLGPLEPGPLELVYLDSDGRRTSLGAVLVPE